MEKDTQKNLALFGFGGAVAASLAWIYNRSKDPVPKAKGNFVAIFSFEDRTKGQLFELDPESTLIDRVAAFFQVKPTSLILVDPTGEEIKQHSIKNHNLLFFSSKLLKPVPYGPRPKPFVQNVPDVIPQFAQSLYRLSLDHGPVFKIALPSLEFVVVSEPDMVQEIFTHADVFQKVIDGVLMEIRKDVAGRGLFSCNDGEEIWDVAHRILLPAFSQANINRYIGHFSEIANDMSKSWDSRIAKGETFDMFIWMNKATTEGISRCAFSATFNLFDFGKQSHVSEALDFVLEESVKRMTRTVVAKFFSPGAERQWQEMTSFLKSEIKKIVENRHLELSKNVHSDKNQKGDIDLLDMAMNGVDPLSKQKLPLENVIEQIVTFFAAGSETTGNMLSWALYLISQHPEVEERLHQEAVHVIGTDPEAILTAGQVDKLTYTLQVLREALRLYPPAPLFGKRATKETTLGVYRIPSDTRVLVSTLAVHRHPKYWPDPLLFNPDRFTPENLVKMHPYQFVPFSMGKRSCIGQNFSLTEAKVFLAKIMLKYFVRLDKSANVLPVEKLTLRPQGLIMKLHVRLAVSKIPPMVTPVAMENSEKNPSSDLILAPILSNKDLPSIIVLYGTSTKTTETFAERFSKIITQIGFKLTDFASLDEYSNENKWNSHKNTLFIIFGCTYNGCPPDTALKFDNWMDQSLKSKKKPLFGSKYAVFGCGSSDYPNYQSFPRKMDNGLEALGAERHFERGEGNTKNSLEDAIKDWTVRFVAHLRYEYNIGEEGEKEITANFQIVVNGEGKDVVKSGESVHKPATMMKISKKNLLTKADKDRAVWHMELDLPTDQKYVAGDHLGVFPVNSKSQVEKALKAVNLTSETLLEIQPVGNPEEKRKMTAREFFAYFVELNRYASKNSIELLSHFSPEESKPKLLELVSNKALYESQIVQLKTTITDLVLQYKINVPLSFIPDIWTKTTPRFYSIASSSLTSPSVLSLTIGLLSESVPNAEPYLGTCSSYLGSCQVNDSVAVYVKDTKSAFKLRSPSDNIILIGAGTGVAPFRGFLQERLEWRKQGKTLGKCVMYFGCRHPNEDFLYENELKDFEKEGITTLHTAFSRLNVKKEYVQDKILENKEEMWELVEQGKAIVYICGSGKMARDVTQAFLQIFQVCGFRNPTTANVYLNAMLESQRFLQDVWG